MNASCDFSLIYLCALVCGLFLSSRVSAQVNPSVERDAAARQEQEQIRRQQQEQQQRLQFERGLDVRSPERVETLHTLAMPVETPCIVMKRLEIKGLAGSVVSEFDEVLRVLMPKGTPFFSGQCVGVRGVAWVIEQAQKILIDQGFVTSRVLVDDQDMSQGTLVLTLVPGRIHAIRLADPTDGYISLGNALPMRAGDVLNLRDIEQALENLKRVPTAEADIQIEPAKGGEARLGDSDLVVTYRQAFPLRLSVSVDDSGTKATGRYQGSVTVSYDNALRLNDLFYVTHTQSMGGGDIGPRGTHANTTHYSVPIGNWTIGATSSTSSYYQTVAGLNQSYVYRGTSENNEVKFNRLLMRDGSQKLNFAVRAFQRRSNNYIDDTEVNVQRRVEGGWDAALDHKIFIQDATLESGLTYRRGTGAFGSLPAPEEAFGDGTSRFALVTADVNLALPFQLASQRVRYNVSWRLQENKSSLTPQDRFVIGGRYSVRGYDGESVLSAERGWFWRNDLSFAMGDSGHEFYVGLDTGQVGGASSELLVATRLTGAVLGMRGAIHSLNYDFFIGAPIHRPDNFNTAKSTAGFSLSANF